MSTAYSGVIGIVTSGGVDMQVSGWSADVEQTTFDATTTADMGWQSVKPAIKKVSGSFDFFFNTGINPYDSAQNMFNGVPVALALTTATGKTLAGNAVVTKLSHKSDVKDGIKMTASFDSDGVWTLPT
jgi:hypothetical protein